VVLLKIYFDDFLCVFPCILYINEQWCNSKKCTIFIKYDVLTRYLHVSA
jgi:hypothetical protein